MNEANKNDENQIMLHLDIQNYYDELDIGILLNLLEQNIEPTTKQKYSFDAITKSQIESFISYIQGNRLGIPQSDNDLSSSFIGFLYLVFGDLFIDQEIENHNGALENYSIFRYMDDYYISFVFRKGTKQFEKEKFVNQISSHIADLLYRRLGLRLNVKTRFFWLSEEDDKNRLVKSLKKVSPGYEKDDEDDEKEDPEKRLNQILKQLRALKNSPLDPSFQLHRDVDTEVLKDVYIESVNSLMKSSKYAKRIDKLFKDFNFDLVIAQPKEIVIILLHSVDVTLSFQKYLLEKDRLSSRDAFLILNFLCQVDFQKGELIKKLKEYEQLRPIMETFLERTIGSKVPGYFDLDENQTLKIVLMGNVIEQVRLRKFAEQKRQYSVALNHLLNEIHSIAWQLDPVDKEQHRYKAPDVIKYLTARKVPHEIRIQIRNLFDRRNKTPISHADMVSWPVSESEYLEFRNQVGECLKYLL